MSKRSAVLSFEDRARLLRFIQRCDERLALEEERIKALRQRFEDAVVVPQQEVPRSAVTMHSQLRLRDLVSGRSFIWTVALPPDAQVSASSALPSSWPSAALLGLRQGDEVHWQTRTGIQRLRIEEVVFQPEASQRETLTRRKRSGGAMRSSAPKRLPTTSRSSGLEAMKVAASSS
jgi:regulator of nucleoside diphosphate kinase